jgi:hypothetical protein
MYVMDVDAHDVLIYAFYAYKSCSSKPVKLTSDCLFCSLQILHFVLQHMSILRSLRN